MSRRLALIVGINQYQDTTFQPLQFAEQDARAIAQWLVNEKGGQWAPADVQFVQGVHATHTLIESLIKQLCLSMAGPDDLVLIYFAGHSFLDERSGIGCLALADTYYARADTALQLAPLAQQVMLHSRAGRILFFLDAFQYGSLWSIRRQSPFDMQPLPGAPMIQGLSQLNNRIVLCSCRGNEQVPERGERGMGQLMYRTIIGLSGQAQDTETGGISLQSLYRYLSQKLEPQQRPQVFGQAQGPFMLVGSDSPPSPSISTSNPIPVTPSTPFGPSAPSAPPIPSTPPTSPFFQPAERGLFASQNEMRQATYTATATAQLSPSTYADLRQGHTTSGHLASPMVEQHRQQQSQMFLEQTQQALQMQQPFEALKAVNQALQVTPDDVTALTLKAQILGTVGQFQEALTTVDQLIQRNGANPLAWSMRAVILTNSGQHQDALKAIERSLELDSSNPETYTIKTNIMTNLAIQQSQEKGSNGNTLIESDRKRTTPRSFFVALGLQIGGMLMGIIGGVLPILRPTLPLWLSFLLEGFGLALLCVNATRGTYRHGFAHLVPPILTSLLMVGILGVSFGDRTIYRKIIFELQAHTNFLLPILFLAGWLALAAFLPFILALIGLGARLVSGKSSKRA